MQNRSTRQDRATTAAESFAASGSSPVEPRGRGLNTAAVARFFLEDVQGHSWAAFRITFGLYFLIYLLAFVPRLLSTFSSKGFAVPYLIPDLSLPPALCAGVYGLLVSATIALILGYKPRLTAVSVFVLYLYFYLLNIAVKNTSHERLNLLMLLILALASPADVWSLTPSPRTAATTAKLSIWGTRLITLQVAFLYFGAGLWKLLNPSWHSGELLYFNFIGDWATPLGFWLARLLPQGAAWSVMSWTVIGWELLMPVLLFTPKLRLFAVISGTLFHLAVWAFLGIPEFMNCVAAYVLFFPPGVVAERGRRFFNRVATLMIRFSQE